MVDEAEQEKKIQSVIDSESSDNEIEESLKIEDVSNLFNTMKEVARIKVDHFGLESSAEIIEEKNLLVTAEKQGLISIWELKSFRKIHSTKLFYIWISGIKYSHKKNCLFIGTSFDFRIYKICRDNTLNIVKLIPACVLYSFLVLENIGSIIFSVAEGPISIWNLSNLKHRNNVIFNSYRKYGKSLLYIRKYNAFAVAYNDGSIRIYDLLNNKKITENQTTQSKRINEWAFNEKEDLLLVKLETDCITCWKFDGTFLIYYQKIMMPGSYITSMVNLGDHTLFCANNVFCYDTENKEPKELAKLENSIYSFKIFGKKRMICVLQHFSQYFVFFKYNCPSKES